MEVVMKKQFIKIYSFLICLLLVLSLTACNIGSGNKSDSGSDIEDGENNGSSTGGKDNNGGEGSDNGQGGETGVGGSESEKTPRTILTATLSSDGILSLKLSDGSTVTFATISYSDEGNISASYDSTLASELSVKSFEFLGEGRIAIIVGDTKMECSGQLICSHSYGGWKPLSETCAERTLIRYCALCGEGEAKVETLDGAHLTVLHEGRPATCKENGYEPYVTCERCDYTTYKQIDKIPHTPIADKGYPATNTEYGLTDGSHCLVCGEVIIPQHIILPTGTGSIESYSGDYGYEHLLTLPEGEKLAVFYEKIDEAAEAFHESNTDLTDDTVEEIAYSELGLSTEEALAVYSVYRNDNPLYYWLGSVVSYNGDSLFLKTEEPYRTAVKRAEYNAKIYSEVKRITDLAASADGLYEISLIYHDEIIRMTSYSYEPDGVTPSNSPEAHNILGVFAFGEGVCESYAKAFQLLLNYSGVDNLFVTGFSKGEAHAWNLVELDDGRYYWYDLTWDDTPEYMLGVSYNYLAVDDHSIVTWRDYGWVVSEQSSFIETHTPDSPTERGLLDGLDYIYPLPERASAPMPLGKLRMSFTADGVSYVRIGASEVTVTSLPSGNAVIPNTVDYLGRGYTVSMIGALDEKGFIKSVPVGGSPTSLTLPSSIRLITDLSLGIPSLESITVSEDGVYFTSLDGVLFTKNLVTLVKYPEGRKNGAYSIPDATLYVAYGAMDGLSSLSTLDLGSSLSSLGISSFGYLYPDSDTVFKNQVIKGELPKILSSMSEDGKLTVNEDNEAFVLYEGCIYSEDMKTLISYADRTLSLIRLSSSLERIEAYAFLTAISLKEIYLASAPVSIGEMAFFNCIRLESVYIPEGTDLSATEIDIFGNDCFLDAILRYYTE